jgi:feruloyl-CoA synthase
MGTPFHVTADLHSFSIRHAPYRARAVRLSERSDGALSFINTNEPDVPRRTIGEALLEAARRWPDRLWLAQRPLSGEGWEELTYREGAAKATALAAGLLRLGLKRGQVIMILSGNSIEHALLTYAAGLVGIAVCPITPAYALVATDFSRLTGARDLVQPAAYFCQDGPLFQRALDALGVRGTPVIHVRRAPDAANPVSFDDLFGNGDDAGLEAAMALVDPGDIAKLLLTSGSTGSPKAVINTHLNLTTNAGMIRATFDETFDLDPQVMATFLPWSHSLGANAILHTFTTYGASLYLDPGSATPERIGETVRTLKEVRPTYHNTVPVGWALLADQLERDEDLASKFFERVRILQYGGATLAQSVYDRVQRVAVKTVGERITFAAGYGATETAPTVTNVHWPNTRMGLLGLPVPGADLKLLPRDGGQYELRVRGASITPGYLNDRERSAAAFDDEGYFILGDLVRFADPDDPAEGLVFDGRLAEAFKLSSGAWVEAGRLRAGLVAAIGPICRDLIVTGVNEAKAGALVFLAEGPARALVEQGEVSLETLSRHPSVIAAVNAGVERWNAEAPSPGMRIIGALILPDAPDLASGEVTDKGSLAQSRAREVRKEWVTLLHGGGAP